MNPGLYLRSLLALDPEQWCFGECWHPPRELVPHRATVQRWAGKTPHREKRDDNYSPKPPRQAVH